MLCPSPTLLRGIKSVKHKFIVSYFIIALTALSIAHVAQILFLLEPKTGFYKPEYSSTHVLYIIFFICVVIVLAAFGYASRRMPTHPPKVDKPLSIISFFVAISFIVSSGNDLVNSLSSMKILSAMFSLLAAIFFVIYGLSGFSKINVSPVTTLFVIPVWVFRLISSFISFTGMANITENIYDILMLCANIFFFVIMAKILSGVYVIRNIRHAYPVGLVASLICVICTLPRYFVMLIGDKDILHESTTQDISVLATGIFIMAFVFKLYSMKNLDKKKRSTEALDYNGLNALQMYSEYIIDHDKNKKNNLD